MLEELEEYDLSTIRQRENRRTDDDAEDRKYESFNISKKLDEIRRKIENKKNNKRFGY